MPIGTSDGEYFNDTFEHTMSQLYPKPAPVESDTPQQRVSKEFGVVKDAIKSGTFDPQGMNYSPKLVDENPDGTPITPKTSPYIDRNHDVPLGAAALDDGSGTSYGTAVDRRVPTTVTINKTTFDPAQFVHIHEQAEHPHMENLIAQGFSDLAAYTKAHDEIATPTEKAAVMAFAKKNNEDPESFWGQYQKHWSQWVQNAQAQDPEKVHPHTYLKPYQQELRDKMEKLALLPVKPPTPMEQSYAPPVDTEMSIDSDRLDDKGRLPDIRKMKPMPRMDHEFKELTPMPKYERQDLIG